MISLNKIECSPHYREIVDLILQGESGRTISDYLKDNYNENISYSTINKYKRDNLNLEQEIKKRQIQHQQDEAIAEREDLEAAINDDIEAAIDKGLEALAVLDQFIAQGGSIYDDLVNDPNVKSVDKARILNTAIKTRLDWIKSTDDKIIEVERPIDLSAYFSDERIDEALRDEED